MELSFKGQPLLSDSDGRIRRLTEQYLPFDDGLIFSPALPLVDGTNSGIGGEAHNANLTTPNYPPPPRLKPNQLYWPTGAMRWSVFVGLADAAVVDDLLAKYLPGSLTGTLKIKVDSYGPDGNTTVEAIETEMIMLTPRRVTAAEGDDSLWYIPLVDVRYFWQFRNFGALSFGSLTWAALFTKLSTQLGVAIAVDTISGSYLAPDIEEFRRPYENAAQILDAAAHSVGMRVVRQLDGSVKVWGPALAATERAANILTGDVIMGGDGEDMSLPANLSVAFPKIVGGIPFCNNDHHVVTNALSLPSSNTEPDATKTIRSTVWADFSNLGSPSNSSELNSLAAIIASDFAAWYEYHQYDYTFGGLKNWLVTGFDDHVLWSINVPQCLDKGVLYSDDNEDGVSVVLTDETKIITTTRVQSVAGNFGVSNMLHEGAISPLVDRGLVMVELTGTLQLGGSAPVLIKEFAGGAWVNTAYTNTVYDHCEIASGVSGDCFWAAVSCESGRLEALCNTSPDDAHIMFQLTASLSLNGSAAAVILDCNGASTGVAVTVDDVLNQFSGPSGYKGIACWTVCNPPWKIVEMQRRARFIRASLDGPVAPDATVTADVLSYWDGQDPGQSVTVRNSKLTAATADHLEKDDEVICCWRDTVNQPTGEYEILRRFEGWRWATVGSQNGAQVGLFKPWDCTAVDTMAGAGADAPPVAIVVWVPATYTPNAQDAIPYLLSEDSKFVCPLDGSGLRVTETCSISNYSADDDVDGVKRIDISKHWGWVWKKYNTDVTRVLFDWKQPTDARDANSPRDYGFVSLDPNDGSSTWPVWNTSMPIFGEFYAKGKMNWTSAGGYWGAYLSASSSELTGGSSTQRGKLRISSGLIDGSTGRLHDILWSNVRTDGADDPAKTGCGVTIKTSTAVDTSGTATQVHEYQHTHTPGIDTYNGSPNNGALVITINTAAAGPGTITFSMNDGHVTDVVVDGTVCTRNHAPSPRAHVGGAKSYNPPADTMDYCP